MKQLSIKKMAGLLAYSGMYRMLELSNYYILTRAIGLEVPYGVVAVLGAVVMLAGELPITVLGLGVREAAVLVLFSKYAPPEKLVAAGVLFSLVEYVYPNMIGLFFTKKFLVKMVGK